jgi:hypothetical protein
MQVCRMHHALNCRANAPRARLQRRRARVSAQRVCACDAKCKDIPVYHYRHTHYSCTDKTLYPECRAIQCRDRMTLENPSILLGKDPGIKWVIASKLGPL